MQNYYFLEVPRKHVRYWDFGLLKKTLSRIILKKYYNPQLQGICKLQSLLDETKPRAVIEKRELFYYYSITIFKLLETILNNLRIYLPQNIGT